MVITNAKVLVKHRYCTRYYTSGKHENLILMKDIRCGRFYVASFYFQDKFYPQLYGIILYIIYIILGRKVLWLRNLENIKYKNVCIYVHTVMFHVSNFQFININIPG